MKYIYILIMLLVLFILVFLITDSRCEIENFTQIRQNNYICNDPNAINSNMNSDKPIDNSFCTYDNEIVCNRPFADNYDISLDNINKNTISNDISVCGNSTFNNYVDVYEYEKDEDGDIMFNNGNKIKIRATKSDAIGNPLKYIGNEVIVDPSDNRANIQDINKYLKYKNGNGVVYVQSNKIDNSKCKKIDNKICRFPMTDVKINSLNGISDNDGEFKSLVNSNNELMPSNYLTQGARYKKEDLELRSNKKSLYKELFFETNTISGYGLNLWDINGYVTMEQLTSRKGIIINNTHTFNDEDGPILGSYINERGVIINRFGYGFSAMPRNYHELAKYAKDNGIHVALAINKDATKYACGIGSTKAIACDVALARCRSFMTFENLEIYFKDLLSSLQIELKRRRNVYPVKSLLWNIIDSKIIDVKNSDEEKLHKIIDDYINTKDELTLATSYYRLMSHKELYNKILNNKLDDNSLIIKKIERSDESISELPTLVEVMKYIMDKSKKDEESGNTCGILMIDEQRYMNFNNDATEIISKPGCNPLPTLLNICNNKTNCYEAAVIGTNNENKCFILQDIKSTFPDWKTFNDAPIQKEYDDNAHKELISQWNSEKDQIKSNNQVDLANNLLERCKSVGNNCVLYKLNGEVYSYNTLFD